MCLYLQTEIKSIKSGSQVDDWAIVVVFLQEALDNHCKALYTNIVAYYNIIKHIQKRTSANNWLLIIIVFCKVFDVFVLVIAKLLDTTIAE